MKMKKKVGVDRDKERRGRGRKEEEQVEEEEERVRVRGLATVQLIKTLDTDHKCFLALARTRASNTPLTIPLCAV